MFATLWFCMDFKIMYEAACISRAAYLFFLERTCNTDGQQIVRRPHGKERISHTQIIQAPWHGEASFGSASSLAQPDREEDEARGPDPYPDRRGRSIHTVVCAWITHEKETTNGDASFPSIIVASRLGC